MTFLFIVNWLALLLSLFVVGCILGAVFYVPFRAHIQQVVERVSRTVRRLTGVELNRTFLNPILEPSGHPWETEAVLNPAALILGGRTHLIYRAVGADGVSRLGYASSEDGVYFDERLSAPVYVAQDPHAGFSGARRFSPVLYPSGGSWGGCEDPRMVTIEGRVYVTFNMFENWALRVGYISMSEEDFVAKRFYKWQGPYILSHGMRDKNWVLFPEKIKGQFAVLHSIIGDDSERVRIEYTDDLTTLSKRNFESPDPQKIPDRPLAWHNHVRSAGPPPIRTDHGWLVLYHANDHEGYKYKMGAMLLDLADPTRILFRAHSPILEPDKWYENVGKPGIVYSCGAVVQGGELYVYYGGGDRVICVATATLSKFLDNLIKGEAVELAPEPVQVP